MKEKEQAGQKHYRHTVRKDPSVRATEQVREKEYQQTVRKDPSFRATEQIQQRNTNRQWGKIH